MSERIAQFRALVAQDPANPLFRFSLGQTLFQVGDFREATEHLQAAADAKSDWMMPRIMLGKARLALQQKDQARAILSEALKLAITQGHEDPEAEIKAILASLT